MTPFAPVTDKGMFDYATGKWAPAKFKNYVTGETTTTVPSTDVKLPVGTLDLTLGRNYAQIAREGWGEQKSQNGGANPSLSGPATASYHLWAVAPAAQPSSSTHNEIDSLYQNSKVHIDTSVSGLALLAKSPAPGWLAAGLHNIDNAFNELQSKCPCNSGLPVAQALAPIYRQTIALRDKVGASNLDPQSKTSILFELDAKINQFQSALADALGLDLIAFRTNEAHAQTAGFRGAAADESPTSVSPGEEFRVHVHASQATSATRLEKVWLQSRTGEDWKSTITGSAINPTAPVADPVFTVHAADNAAPTAPFFTRPNIEQPYYDISNPQWRERSFAPYPLDAWAEFTFDGLPIRIGEVVQTLQRVTGPGGFYEPLVVTPAVGVSVNPQARIIPLDGSALPVRVTVHTQGQQMEPSHSNSRMAGNQIPHRHNSIAKTRVTPIPSCSLSPLPLLKPEPTPSRPSRSLPAALTIPAGTASATPACDPITNSPPPNFRLAKSMSSLPPASASATSWVPAILSPTHWKAWASARSFSPLQILCPEISVFATSSSLESAPIPFAPNSPRSNPAWTTSSATAERSSSSIRAVHSPLRCLSRWAAVSPSASSMNSPRSSCSILPTPS